MGCLTTFYYQKSLLLVELVYKCTHTSTKGPQECDGSLWTMEHSCHGACLSNASYKLFVLGISRWLFCKLKDQLTVALFSSDDFSSCQVLLFNTCLQVSGIPIHSRYTVAAAASTKASSYRSVASSPKPPASYRSVASSPKPPASSTKPPSSYRSVASNSKSLSSTNYQTSPKSPSSSRTSHRTSPKPSYTSPKSPSPTSYRRDYKAGKLYILLASYVNT